MIKKFLALFHKKPIKLNPTREKIMEVEDIIKKQPNAMYDDCFPLKHTFANGCYVREITMPKDTLLTSKIHKIKHPYFVLKGDVSILTEKGVVRIKAPFSGITEAGTKRILYMHEETVWTTVHITRHKDLKKIENQIIAKDFSKIPDWATKKMEEICA